MLKQLVFGGLLVFLLSTSGLLASPEFHFYMSDNSLKQGDVLKLRVTSTVKLDKPTFQIGSHKGTLFYVKEDKIYYYMAYIGMSMYWSLGSHKIVITLPFKFGVSKKTLYFTLKDGQFSKGTIRLSPTKKKVASKRGELKKESRNISRVFRTKTVKRIFNKPFIRPAKGRISSTFGAYRVYNDSGKTSRHHSGLDIANREKTPVYAVNDGVVKMSASLHSHGNTIILDHGLGVLSIYNHLFSRSVSDNQIVKQGQLIGLMGSTGIATGSHLHWGMSVQNIRVNPLFWLNHAFLYQ